MGPGCSGSKRTSMLRRLPDSRLDIGSKAKARRRRRLGKPTSGLLRPVINSPPLPRTWGRFEPTRDATTSLLTASLVGRMAPEGVILAAEFSLIGEHENQVVTGLSPVPAIFRSAGYAGSCLGAWGQRSTPRAPRGRRSKRSRPVGRAPR